MSVVRFSGCGVNVMVSSLVCDTWQESKQIAITDTEQFGVLVGSKSCDENRFWIEHCSSSQPTDVSKRASFILQAPFHQELVDRIFVQSCGESGYIGTWHTHPEEVPIPSNLDLKDWRQCIHRNPDRQLFFAIIGTQKVKIFTFKDSIVVELKLG